MSLACDAAYGPVPLVIDGTSGETPVCSVAANEKAVVHRMTIANESAATRTVSIKPDGGSATWSWTLLAGTSQDIDEINWRDAPHGTDPVIDISGADVFVRCMYSRHKA